jgi:hypothetical protein
MKKNAVTGAIIAIIAAVVTLVTPAVAQASPYCGIYWGSLAKDGTGQSLPGAGALTNVRAGQHDCYDRLVIDFNGPASGYHVEYVGGVPQQALGNDLVLRGGAFLNIVLRTTAYNIDTGAATYAPENRTELVNVQGWRTLQQVSFGGSFEGYTTVGVGVRARLPFRVFTLPGPDSASRLVIDVAHSW